jgi:paraquat-inducible protein B
MHAAFVAVMQMGLICLNGAGTLALAADETVAPRHSLRGEMLCTAMHHAELTVEAALTELDELPTREWRRIGDEVEVRLAALEAEWRQTAAWIDEVRKDLTSATSRAAELSSQRGTAAGAFVTFS